MKELLEKLSSYNIFNYLLPGVVFVAISEKLTTLRFVQHDVILGLFLYYFIGLIISRLGSIFIEPLLKRLKVVRFESYPDFVSALKIDQKLDILSEANNMYRTFCSLFASLILLKVYERFSTRFPSLGHWGAWILVLGLFTLFCLSYRKQTQYIAKRVQAAGEKR